MTKIIALCTTLLVGATSTALADAARTDSVTTAAIPTAQRIDQIMRGEGEPGEVVRSTSNPEIVFTVMPNGAIERRNERYGTTEYKRPRSPWQRDYNDRGGR